MEKKELIKVINGCKQDRKSDQQKMFMYLYDYGMTIASRYAYNSQETEDIANEGFYKILKNINSYRESIPFRAWARRIIINCGIDHYRKYYKNKKEIENTSVEVANFGANDMDAEYLLQMVRNLPPSYRVVFILHAVEGYSHEEIASQLKISKGTSKSNLSKARKKLQQMVNTHLKTI